MNNTLKNLLTARYGENAIELSLESNTTLEMLLSHKSIRHYQDKPLPDGALELLITAAQSAASSSNLQLWSVVAITDTERKQRLSQLSNNQAHITQAPLFLVWLADVARLETIMQKNHLNTQGLHQLDLFLIAVIDATLAAQNAVIAAESQGWGTVYIGALRNQVKSVAEELKLPDGVFPVFGLCVGYPNTNKSISIKPRLPQSAVLHKETYQQNAPETEIQSYDEVMTRFYQENNMNVQGTWSQHCSQRILERATHSQLQAFLAERFNAIS